MARLLTKWNHKAGVEFTRIHKDDYNFSPHDHDINGDKVIDISELCSDSCECRFCIILQRQIRRRTLSGKPMLPSVLDNIRDSINTDMELKPLIWNIGTDPGCVEIPSAPLNNWKSLRKFYMRVDEVCKKHNYTANDNAIGTGSHIHVEHLGNHATILKVLRDSYYRPYVKWAFANPQDDYNCPPHTVGEFPHWEFNTFRFNYLGVRAYNLRYEGNAIAVQNETLEFRLFDMTWNWGEQEEHMAYVQAYMTWILSDSYKIPKPLEHKFFKSIPLTESIKMFKDHIEELGLPWNRYEKYVGYIELHYKWKNLGNAFGENGSAHDSALIPMAKNIAKYDTNSMLKELTTTEFCL